MSDVLTKEQRQYCMSRIRGKDTKPEMIVRKLVHSLGYRYRLHVKKLPGCPDLVFPSRKKVIFVHGCFWHRHKCKYGRATPATRKRFWQEKFEKTIQRDKKNRNILKKLGWKVLPIWECQIHPSKIESLKSRIKKFLEE